MGSQAIAAARDSSRDGADRAMDAIRRLVRILRLAARDAEELGVTAAQLFVLRSLDASPASSMGELAARTRTDPSSVSVVVAKLHARRLVSRKVDPRDARRVAISLTTRGRALAARGPDLAQGRLVAAIEALPAAQRRAMTVALERVVRDVGGGELAPEMFFEEDVARAKPAPRRGQRGKT